MRKIILASIFILIFCVYSFAQIDENLSCPPIRLEGPPGLLPPGQSGTFTVFVETNENLQLKYEWTVERGRIIEGQGTPTVRVSEPIGVTVTVNISGLHPDCSNTFSENLPPHYPPKAKKLKQFIYTDSAIDESILDNFAEALRNKPLSQAYILIGSEKGAPKKVFDNKLREISDYVVYEKLVDKDQILFLDVFNTKNLIKLWIVPFGADIPDEIKELTERGHIRKNNTNR